MNQHEAFKDTIELATLAGMAQKEVAARELSYGHLLDMWERIKESEHSDAKMGRWLGWAQAAVVAAGCATLDDMKSINMRWADG